MLAGVVHGRTPAAPVSGKGGNDRLTARWPRRWPGRRDQVQAPGFPTVEQVSRARPASRSAAKVHCEVVGSRCWRDRRAEGAVSVLERPGLVGRGPAQPSTCREVAGLGGDCVGVEITAEPRASELAHEPAAECPEHRGVLSAPAPRSPWSIPGASLAITQSTSSSALVGRPNDSRIASTARRAFPR